jgi:DNA-damage-inducible protein J
VAKLAKKDDVIRARINHEIKEEATTVLAAIGMTPSMACCLLMQKIAVEKKLPFNPLEPNETTIEAMKAARRGEAKKVASVKALFDELDEDNDD